MEPSSKRISGTPGSAVLTSGLRFPAYPARNSFRTDGLKVWVMLGGPLVFRIRTGLRKPTPRPLLLLVLGNPNLSGKRFQANCANSRSLEERLYSRRTAASRPLSRFPVPVLF